MKRIALLVCAVLLLVANTAEARYTWTYYPQPARVAPATYSARPVQPVYATRATYAARPVQPVYATRATYVARPVQQAYARPAAYNTSTAQGVANIMASTGTVGHWGGNTGYEGCGSGATAAAAYHNCCFANSGMTTVDVGYAQGANGMWYCCRRYR